MASGVLAGHFFLPRIYRARQKNVRFRTVRPGPVQYLSLVNSPDPAKRPDVIDCLIVGAGPAGLTAAVYLARYRRRIRLISAGPSRAQLIPLTHNFPGFPDGVSGANLLERLQAQAFNYGVETETGRIESLEHGDGRGFAATSGEEVIRAATVILATGVVDQHPDFDGLSEATLGGLVRWCPICDGYEVMDQSIAILSPAKPGLRHALFLRTYTRRITLLALGDSQGLSQDEVSQMEAAEIEFLTAPVVSFKADAGNKCVVVALADGTERRFDTVYPMHGCSAQGGLATALGARSDAQGDLVVDARQQTSVAGLYAVGDVVSALNQISVGIGHAAIAATAVHNSLARVGR